MASPVFSQAWKGTISWGGTLFNALQFSYTDTAPLEDITYSVAGGATFAVKLPGYRSISGNVQFVYDTANQPTISPFDMVSRSATAAIIIYPEGTKAFSFSAYTSNFQFSTGPQAGVSVKCSCDFESTGAVTVPSS